MAETVAGPVSAPKEAGEAQPQSEAPAARPPSRPGSWEFPAKVLAVVLFLGVMVLLLLEAPWATESTGASQNQTTSQLAELLFGGFGASFALLSIVMGVAIIGGLFLAKEDPAEEDPAKDGTVKDGPAKDGTAKDGPAKDGPAKDGPAKDGQGPGKRDGEGGGAP